MRIMVLAEYRNVNVVPDGAQNHKQSWAGRGGVYEVRARVKLYVLHDLAVSCSSDGSNQSMHVHIYIYGSFECASCLLQLAFHMHVMTFLPASMIPVSASNWDCRPEVVATAAATRCF